MTETTQESNQWKNKQQSPFFDGREIIRMSWKSSEPFPVDKARSQLDSFLQEQIRSLISPRLSPLMRPAYIDSRISYMISQIHKNLAPWYANVSYINYVDSWFRFYDADKKELYRADFSKLWNESQLPPDRLADIQAKAREQEEAMKQILERESLLGGSVIIEWAITGAYVWLAWDAYVRWWVKALNMLDKSAAMIGDLGQSHTDGRLGRMPLRTMKNIWVQNTSWKLEKIYLGERLAEYSSKGPEWVRTNTIKMLQSVWVYFDPVKKTFTNIGARATMAMLEMMKKISFQEYRSKYGANISETEWKRMKGSLSELSSLLTRSWNSVVEMMSWAIWNGLHIVMFPVFFALFQREPNSATLVAWLAEWALFSAGAKAWAIVWNELGPFGRFLGPLVWWISSVTVGHELYTRFDGDKKKWKIFNGQDMFSNETFAALHLATWWGVNEYFDWLNDGGLFFTEEEMRRLHNGGKDIWVPMVDWQQKIQATIPQKELAWWVTKYWPIGFLTWWWVKSLIWMGDGGGWVTPDIDFYKRKVAFNMNPWEWFNASLKWRSVDKWNTQVDFYAKSLQEDIGRLLGNYIWKQSPFNLEKNQDILKSMLQMRLGIMMMPVGNGIFNPYAQKLIQAILSETENWNKDRSPKNVSELIVQFSSFMKIDASFVRMNQIQLDAEINQWENGILSGQLVQDFDTFANQLKDSKQKQYIKSIVKRVVFGDKNLFDPDKVDSNPFSERVHINVSAEHKIFNAILYSNDVVTGSASMTNINETRTESIQVWKKFVSLLERLAFHCRNRDFQNRLAQIDKKTQQVHFWDTTRVEWNFAELNTFKKLFWIWSSSQKSVLDQK